MAEQPSDEIKAYVEKQIAEKDFDMILSHTCPFKYEPTEVFLPMIDQSTVDASTEHWLDQIEESILQSLVLRTLACEQAHRQNALSLP